MKIEGYSKLSKQEKDILHALLDLEGIKVNHADIVDGRSQALGINWCKILCGIKAAAAIAACAGNPVCIAAAIADGIKCVSNCS